MIEKREWEVLADIKAFLRRNADGGEWAHGKALQAIDQGDWGPTIGLLRSHVRTGEIDMLEIVRKAADNPNDHKLEDMAVEGYVVLNERKSWLNLLEKREGR